MRSDILLYIFGSPNVNHVVKFAPCEEKLAIISDGQSVHCTFMLK